MITFDAEVTEAKLTDAYIDLLGVLPDFTNAIVSRTVNDIGPQILQDLDREPGPVQLPIEWTTERQRRYVMAQKGRGRIPKQGSRTHEIALGWKYRVVYTPGQLSSLEVYNAVPGVSFVEGRDQQIFHKNTGWLHAPDVIAPWIEVLTDDVETALIKAFIVAEDWNA